jgi:hypothetical protein
MSRVKSRTEIPRISSAFDSPIIPSDRARKHSRCIRRGCSLDGGSAPRGASHRCGRACLPGQGFPDGLRRSARQSWRAGSTPSPHCGRAIGCAAIFTGGNARDPELCNITAEPELAPPASARAHAREAGPIPRGFLNTFRQ